MNIEILKLIVIMMLSFSFTLSGQTYVQAQEPTAAATEMSPEEKAKNDDMMAKWMAYSTPNENHKVLEQFVGNWDTTMKAWMPGSEAAQESTGTSSIEWILGGRFIQQKFSGTHMGQPFEGIGITGYDNQKQKYQSVWIDNMGTGMMNSTLNYDAATKTFAEEGSFSCPMKGGDLIYRAVMTIKDADHYSYEMYTTDEGKESKMMEIQYTRKQ
jgi:hypothetical protein